MAITFEQATPELLVRHKGGKLYKIKADYKNPTAARLVTEGYGDYDPNAPKVWATQWQINEKYPEGRYFQASRALKLADLTIVGDKTAGQMLANLCTALEG